MQAAGVLAEPMADMELRCWPSNTISMKLGAAVIGLFGELGSVKNNALWLRPPAWPG